MFGSEEGRPLAVHSRTLLLFALSSETLQRANYYRLAWINAHLFVNMDLSLKSNDQISRALIAVLSPAWAQFSGRPGHTAVDRRQHKQLLTSFETRKHSPADSFVCLAQTNTESSGNRPPLWAHHALEEFQVQYFLRHVSYLSFRISKYFQYVHTWDINKCANISGTESLITAMNQRQARTDVP